MITMSDYAARRKKLMQAIGENAIVVIPSAVEIIRNGDAVYPFRQNSDFYYLTGFDEPDSVLILLPGNDAPYILFNRVRDKDREIWDGPRAGQEGAVQAYKADQAYPIEEFKEVFPKLLQGVERIYYTLGQHKHYDKLILDTINALRMRVRAGMQPPLAIIDIASLLHEMRLIKTPAEIKLMRHAVEITAAAHEAAMKQCKPGMYEYELEAILLYEFKKRGAFAPAYTSIVGAGKNSCILHYILNNQKIHSGDLILIDAGAEYKNYASDITRTFPASGKFTDEQKAIYEIVLASQLAAIKTIKPGVSWNEAQTVIVNVITEGLLELGILKGKLHDLVENQAYFPFYMHRSGHWLGLDVHDVGVYKINGEWRPLQAGMALTVEPGIYIAADQTNVDPRWHNIGVRIEDNVVVTDDGCEVLSQQIPKRISDIEALMGG